MNQAIIYNWVQWGKFSRTTGRRSQVKSHLEIE